MRGFGASALSSSTTHSALDNAHGAQLLYAFVIMLLEGCGMALLAMYLNISKYRGMLFFVPDSWKCRFGGKGSGVENEPIELEKSVNQTSAQTLLSAADANKRDADEEDIDVALERQRVNALVKNAEPSNYPGHPDPQPS